MCNDNDTDSVELYFTVNNKKLKLDITFSVDQINAKNDTLTCYIIYNKHLIKIKNFTFS